MDAREQRAYEITGDARIRFVAGVWHVHSQTTSRYYKVNPSPTAPACECEDFALRAKPCKHILAVRLLAERQQQGEPNPDPATIPMRAPRPQYKQDCPAYNLAQTTEKRRFQVLLADLCSGVPSPPLTGRGQRPAPIPDVLFATAFKVYSTVSTRRFNGTPQMTCPTETNSTPRKSGFNLSWGKAASRQAQPMHPIGSTGTP